MDLFGLLSDNDVRTINTILNFLALVVLGGGATQLPRVIRKNSTDPVVERLDHIETRLATVAETGQATDRKVNGLITRVEQIEGARIDREEGANDG